MNNHQKERIAGAIKNAIERAKEDRTSYERNMLGLMDWQNKAQSAKEIFENDERSTVNIINDLIAQIEGYLER